MKTINTHESAIRMSELKLQILKILMQPENIKVTVLERIKVLSELALTRTEVLLRKEEK